MPICGNSSVVELHLAKVDVAGSNPVSRSHDKGDLRLPWIVFFLYIKMVTPAVGPC